MKSTLNSFWACKLEYVPLEISDSVSAEHTTKLIEQYTWCLWGRVLHVSILPNRKRNQTITETSNQHNISIWLQYSWMSGIRIQMGHLFYPFFFPLSTSFLCIATCNGVNHMTRFHRKISTIALMIPCPFSYFASHTAKLSIWISMLQYGFHVYENTSYHGCSSRC